MSEHQSLYFKEEFSIDPLFFAQNEIMPLKVIEPYLLEIANSRNGLNSAGRYEIQLLVRKIGDE